MTIIEILFLIQFIGIIGISFFKVYNLLSLGKIYNLKASFVLFALFFIMYVIGLCITLTDYTYAIYSILFLFECWLIPVQIFFLLGELAFNGMDEIQKVYKSG